MRPVGGSAGRADRGDRERSLDWGRAPRSHRTCVFRLGRWGRCRGDETLTHGLPRQVARDCDAKYHSLERNASAPWIGQGSLSQSCSYHLYQFHHRHHLKGTPLRLGLVKGTLSQSCSYHHWLPPHERCPAASDPVTVS
jgi:hypothetical protein